MSRLSAQWYAKMHFTPIIFRIRTILTHAHGSYGCRGSDRVAAIAANFQATTSIGNLVSISSSNRGPVLISSKSATCWIKLHINHCVVVFWWWSLKLLIFSRSPGHYGPMGANAQFHDICWYPKMTLCVQAIFSCPKLSQTRFGHRNDFVHHLGL